MVQVSKRLSVLSARYNVIDYVDVKYMRKAIEGRAGQEKIG